MLSMLLPLLYRLLRVLIIGLLSSYLVTCAILYLAQERLIFHPRVLPSNFTYPFTLPFREIFLPVDGAILAAVHFTQPDARGVVFYLHGNATTLASAELNAMPFVQRGYDVFLLDYRGYGKSTGVIVGEADLHQDVRVAYDYLRQTYPEDQIVIYGQSLGTGLAIQLAAKAAPRMLILEAPYLSLEDLVAQKVPFVPLFLLKYPLRSDRWIGAVRCPIYFFHGVQDQLIPYDSSERLLHRSTAPSQLILINDAHHADLPASEVYQTKLDQILRDSLLE